jgi:hypothetical protein
VAFPFTRNGHFQQTAPVPGARFYRAVLSSNIRSLPHSPAVDFQLISPRKLMPGIAGGAYGSVRHRRQGRKETNYEENCTR